MCFYKTLGILWKRIVMAGEAFKTYFESVSDAQHPRGHPRKKKENFKRHGTGAMRGRGRMSLLPSGCPCGA